MTSGGGGSTWNRESNQKTAQDDSIEVLGDTC